MPEFRGHEIPIGLHVLEEFLINGVRQVGIILEGEPVILWPNGLEWFRPGAMAIEVGVAKPIKQIKPEWLEPFQTAEDEDA